DAPDAKLRVDDGIRAVAHLAGPDRVEERVARGADAVLDRAPVARGGEHPERLPAAARDAARAGDAPGHLDAAGEDVEVPACGVGEVARVDRGRRGRVGAREADLAAA